YVTWPLLKAHVAKHGPLALVQFDAHQDTWFDEERRIDHGSFVARAAREGIIDPDRSIQIGIRTHAPEDCGVNILYGHQVEEMSASD
ncbi:arginase family protein, partial [Rhizobium ruizarguesonis]